MAFIWHETSPMPSSHLQCARQYSSIEHNCNVKAETLLCKNKKQEKPRKQTTKHRTTTATSTTIERLAVK
eukprot:scaffold42198_cov16-Prasinocladus_malaysianus.AAC.1